MSAVQRTFTLPSLHSRQHLVLSLQPPSGGSLLPAPRLWSQSAPRPKAGELFGVAADHVAAANSVEADQDVAAAQHVAAAQDVADAHHVAAAQGIDH